MAIGRPQGDKPKAHEEPSPWSLVGAGVELGGVVAVLSLGGWWLDGKLDSSPWFLLTGLAVGTIGGLYNMARQAKQHFKD